MTTEYSCAMYDLKMRVSKSFKNKIQLNGMYGSMHAILCRICTETKLARKEQFNCENKKHADTRGGDHFDEEIQKTPKAEPLQQYQISMVEQGEYKHIHGIGCPLHGQRGRFTVIEFGTVFRSKDVDDKRPYIRNQCTGGSM